MGFSNVFPFKWCFFREFHILSKTISLRNVWCWNEIEDEIVDWVNHGKTLGKTSSNMMKYGKNHWENHVKPCATLAKNIGKTMVKCCKLWAKLSKLPWEIYTIGTPRSWPVGRPWTAGSWQMWCHGQDLWNKAGKVGKCAELLRKFCDLLWFSLFCSDSVEYFKIWIAWNVGNLDT